MGRRCLSCPRCAGRRSAREDHGDRRHYRTAYSSRTAGRDRSPTSTASLHARVPRARLGISATAPHKRSVAPRRVAPSTIWLPPPPALASAKLAPSQPPPGSGRARFARSGLSRQCIKSWVCTHSLRGLVRDLLGKHFDRPCAIHLSRFCAISTPWHPKNIKT